MAVLTNPNATCPYGQPHMYGAGAREGLDESFKEQLAARNAVVVREKAQKEHENSAGVIDKQLFEARRRIRFLVDETRKWREVEAGLVKRREMEGERKKRMERLKNEKAERQRRREAALGMKKVEEEEEKSREVKKKKDFAEW